jgi:hypothetical protein
VLGNLLGAMFTQQPYVSNKMMKKMYGVFMIVIGLRH